MLRLRSAEPRDVPVMLRFIRELAEYEREPDAVIATEADLLRDGFALAAEGVTALHDAAGAAQPRRFRALIAEWQGSAEDVPQPAGFALYFTSYSTWLGHHGIRLEDLYVTPSHRGHGIGKALLAALARIAMDEGCGRLEWDVLTWNTPAIEFYRSLGAGAQSEWQIMRLAGEPLQALAAHAPHVEGADTVS